LGSLPDWNRDYAQNQWDPEYERDSLARAQEKLEALERRSVPLTPAGRFVGPLIVDLATRKTVVQEMRKILVRVGDEWHLFNGEWMGIEETDVGWTARDP